MLYRRTDSLWLCHNDSVNTLLSVPTEDFTIWRQNAAEHYLVKLVTHIPENSEAYALDKSNDSQSMILGPAASVSPVKYKFLETQGMVCFNKS